jgi:hypothetical protein
MRTGIALAVFVRLRLMDADIALLIWAVNMFAFVNDCSRSHLAKTCSFVLDYGRFFWLASNITSQNMHLITTVRLI